MKSRVPTGVEPVKKPWPRVEYGPSEPFCQCFQGAEAGVFVLIVRQPEVVPGDWTVPAVAVKILSPNS